MQSDSVAVLPKEFALYGNLSIDVSQLLLLGKWYSVVGVYPRHGIANIPFAPLPRDVSDEVTLYDVICASEYVCSQSRHLLEHFTTVFGDLDNYSRKKTTRFLALCVLEKPELLCSRLEQLINQTVSNAVYEGQYDLGIVANWAVLDPTVIARYH